MRAMRCGYSAHAEIDPNRVIYEAGALALLRARGDRPYLGNVSNLVREATPRTRRSTSG